MGQVVSTQSTWDHYSSDLQWVVFSANMNKFLAIACLAAVAVAKPEAEADPALLYGAYGYAGLGHIGHPHAYGYAGFPYAAAGYASYSPSASTHIAGLAPAAVPALAGGYAGAGRYIANSAGVVHVAKREAEADADPALLYGAHGCWSWACWISLHLWICWLSICRCWICFLQSICQHPHCWSCPRCCPSPSWWICRCWSLCC